MGGEKKRGRQGPATKMGSAVETMGHESRRWRPRRSRRRRAAGPPPRTQWQWPRARADGGPRRQTRWGRRLAPRAARRGVWANHRAARRSNLSPAAPRGFCIATATAAVWRARAEALPPPRGCQGLSVLQTTRPSVHGGDGRPMRRANRRGPTRGLIRAGGPRAEKVPPAVRPTPPAASFGGRGVAAGGDRPARAGAARAHTAVLPPLSAGGARARGRAAMPRARRHRHWTADAGPSTGQAAVVGRVWAGARRRGRRHGGRAADGGRRNVSDAMRTQRAACTPATSLARWPTRGTTRPPSGGPFSATPTA